MVYEYVIACSPVSGWQGSEFLRDEAGGAESLRELLTGNLIIAGYRVYTCSDYL